MERMNTAPKRVRTIPATVQPLNVYSTEYLLKRVAAYCRVSTKQEEQLNSYETQVRYLLGLDSDTFYIYHVAAVMVDNLRRLLLGINLSDKAIMDFDFPGVGFPV